MNLTTYGKNKIIDAQRGTGITAFTGYLALSTTLPADDGSGVTEPVGGTYAREPITWDAPIDGVSANAEIVFTATGAPFGTIGWVVVFDALTSGNPWMWVALDAAKVVADGDTLTFSAGDLDWTVE